MKNNNLLAALIATPLFAFAGDPDRPELPKTFRDHFADIPAGVLNAAEGEVKMGAFLLSTTEVSNAEYMAFVADVRKRGDTELLVRVLPDSTQWRKDYAYSEPYTVHYHAHPAYANYPAVNISSEAAMAYCQWLQERMNAQSSAGQHYTVRLPSRDEWWYAANGGKQRVSYAWGGAALHNAKGCALANYRTVGDENVRRDPATGLVELVDATAAVNTDQDGSDVTAPVDSYMPNAYGLFNMNGNVAEMLAEPGQAAGGSWRSPGYDVRNESVMAFNGPSPEVGFRVLVEVR